MVLTRGLVGTLLGIALIFGNPFATAETQSPEATPEIAAFIHMIRLGRRDLDLRSVHYIDERWDDAMVPMVLETIQLSRNLYVGTALYELLAKRTGVDHKFSQHDWYSWWWSERRPVHPDYAAYKTIVYGFIDKKFPGYFEYSDTASIRLDEVIWGGVRQDAIPPLRYPKMVKPHDASYLADSDVVFGMSVDGDARAYPKRILAWHEMFVDTVGATPVTGVYCTMCGAVVLYKTEFQGVVHQLGTSGFLYRSNKLMYDKATQSLWSTFGGTPVIGSLVGRGIELERLSVVTTTWGEWRNRHPDTLVLSLETGHKRDYAEGAAYKKYFATDALMFGVPKLDSRLRNKDEVLALVFPNRTDESLAIAADFLAQNPVYRDRLGPVELTVFTDSTGANRVYETMSVEFLEWDQSRSVTDADGNVWTLSEASLEAPDGRSLARLPGHRAFWFGWVAANPGTRLVH